MLRELWGSIPAAVKKVIITWAIVAAGLWLIKLVVGVGILLVALFAILAVAGALGHARGEAWVEKQVVGQIGGLILPPVAFALSPEVWRLFKQVAVERSYDSLLTFVVFLAVAIYILYMLREAIQGIFKR